MMIYFFNETWLNTIVDRSIMTQLASTVYLLKHVPRPSGTGGAAVICRQKLIVDLCSSSVQLQSFGITELYI